MLPNVHHLCLYLKTIKEITSLKSVRNNSGDLTWWGLLSWFSYCVIFHQISHAGEKKKKKKPSVKPLSYSLVLILNEWWERLKKKYRAALSRRLSVSKCLSLTDHLIIFPSVGDNHEVCAIVLRSWSPHSNLISMWSS